MFINQIKQHIPVIFFIVITAFWSYYYLSSNRFNEYGHAKFEYLLLIDGLLVLPILCWICIDKRHEALLKIITYSCLIIFIGSYIIPEENQHIWNHLEQGRYVILALLILLELVAIVSLLMAIKEQLHQSQDLDTTINTPIEKFFGQTIVSQLICLEIRMWTYLLFHRRIAEKQRLEGILFSYHNKDDAKSYVQGFAWIMVFELFPVHVLLHYMVSPSIATIVTALTIFSILWTLSESRAMTLRPITLTTTHLTIRYGLRKAMSIRLENIRSITDDSEQATADTKPGVKTLNYVGEPNILIHLKTPYEDNHMIAIGIDNPRLFIHTLNTRLNEI